MEDQYQRLDEEMPIPDEHTKPNTHAVPNSKLNSKDYGNQK